MPNKHTKATLFLLLPLFFLLSGIFCPTFSHAAPDDISYIITTDTDSAISNVSIYAFTEGGSYTGIHSATDFNGKAYFDSANFPANNYLFRVDYNGYQFWSDLVSLTGPVSHTHIIPHRNSQITVGQAFQGEPSNLSGLRTYLFSAQGSYLGESRTTDANGHVVYNLPDQEYKIRADYLGQQFWSEVFRNTDTSILIPMGDAAITVIGAGLPLAGVTIYAFSETGAYLGINATSNANGKALFRLPASGTYKFRADHLGNQYWSVAQTLVANQANPIEISTGGGLFSFSLRQDVATPVTGITCFLFNEAGSYLGMNGTTDDDGQVFFNMADGAYKIRVDYQGYQFWSNIFSVPATFSGTLTLPHQDITITVAENFQAIDTALPGIKTYLFSPSGSYLGQSRTTDANGQVVYNLPDQEYKIRADYLGQQFWSEVFRNTDTSILIPMGDAAITVIGAGLPLAGVTIYAFSETDAYLGINATSDANGKALFRLPASGTYKFRADHLGNQYWSVAQTLVANQANPIEISTGGGLFSFSLLQDAATPVPGATCYLFNEAGSYLGMNGTSDTDGHVFFNMPDGAYKIRVDYQGYQFWSNIFSVPATFSGTLTLPHQDITITVAENFQAIDTALPGINTYLFSPSGSYLGQSRTTDVNGQVVFNLPDQEYKIRADFLGQQFWSEVFRNTDTTVSIGSGQAAVHVHSGQTDTVNANVYLFNASGAYLGQNLATDIAGKAVFQIPAGSFKFRVDLNGEQHWSPVVGIAHNSLVTVDIDTSPIAVSLNSNTSILQFGASATLYWSSTGANGCTIEPGIGQVDSTGSMTIIPETDTTYTITATGTSGTATASVSVTVIKPVISQEKFTTPDILSLDELWFGASVAVSGNYAVVGAPLTDIDGMDNSGAVYIFKKEGDTWVETAQISASDGQAGELFGSSVAIDGDTVIVGAPYAEVWTGAGQIGYYNSVGAVYIYQRQGSAWVEQATRLNGEYAYQDEAFGYSVAISGDRVIVGTNTTGNNLYNPRVVIFSFDGTDWAQQAELSPSDPESFWLYGNSVDISGNYAVVGAPYNGMQSDRGSVYVYRFNGTEWLEDQVLTTSDGENGDHFGWSVAIHGDSIIAGAVDKDFVDPTAPPPTRDEPGLLPGREGGGTTPGTLADAGAAYIFSHDGTSWSEQAKLVASDPAYKLNMGLFVAIYDDYAIASSEYNRDSGVYENANYLFRRFGSRWVEQGILYAGQASRHDDFGPSVAISYDTIMIGDFANHPSDIYPQIASDPYFRPGAAFAYDVPRTSVKLTLTPPIDPNGESLLSWTTKNAWSCAINQGYGSVALNGSIPIKVDDDTIYSATVQGIYGSGTDSVTMIVGYPPPEITVSGPTAPIPPGETATLTWSTTPYTDTMTIDNGIGSVPVSGFIEITPQATTIYTFVAAGPGGTDTKSITVTVLPPSVTLSATPTDIELGQSTTLSWSSSFADSVSINNGIGSVAASGSLAVSPASSTTYTITATGPSGTATAEVAVNVTLPVPTVSLSSDPAAILAGETVTLSWQTEYAQTVLLAYGLTSLPVPASGSLNMTPTATTTYRIEATNTTGTNASAKTVQVLDPASLGIAITSPLSGASLSVPQALVQGVVTTGADEVGVVVNGYPAQVLGNRWFVNNLPLTEGDNTITATATQPDGATATDTLSVTVDTSVPTDWLDLNLSPDSGIAPLDTRLNVTPHTSFAPTTWEIAIAGPARDVTITSTSDTDHNLTFPTPGFYTIIFTMSDDFGDEAHGEVMVNVIDGVVLEALLQSRWDGLKDRLAAQDIDGGMGYFLESSKDRYQQIFAALATQLPQIIAEMQPIEMISSRNGRTKFRINRSHMINGAPVTITYYIYFVIDQNGLMKIEEF